MSDLVNDAVEASTAVKKHFNDELFPDEVYTSSEVAESIGETSFRCFQCRMLFLPSSNMDRQNIVNCDSCQRHIGVLKFLGSLVLVGLSKIRCHRGVCNSSV